MAKTQVGSTDDVTRIAWEEKLFRDTLKDIFFMVFHGKSDSMVHEKTDPKGTQKQGSQPATQVVFTLRQRQTGSGVTSRQTLEGNEESLTTFSHTLSLEEYANAIRDAGPLDRMRPFYKMDEESRTGIKDWGAEKQDELHFDAIQTSPTRVFAPTQAAPYITTPLASAKTALTTSDKPTPEFLSKLRVYARTGGARTIIPLRPVRVPGFNKDLYVFLTHDDAVYDFVQDSKMQQNLREARERSKNHPLFMGAVGYTTDGVVIFGHENMNIGLNAGAGSNVPFAQGAFMGAQALVFAWGMRPKVVSKNFDYDREHGHSWQVISKVEKPVFDSEDYGSFGVIVNRTSISDAT